MSTPDLVITFFDDWEARTKIEKRITLDALAERIRTTTAPKKDVLPWLKFARFGGLPSKGGSLRWNGNVLALSGVVGDYDSKRMSPEEAADRLDKAGITGIIYTTPSHSEEAPRWRVGCQFAGELAPDLHYQMVSRLNGNLGGVLATESWTLSQCFYYGSVKANLAHRVIVVDGTTTLDRCDDLDADAIGKPNGGAQKTEPGGTPEALIADIVAALAVIPNPIPSWDLKNGSWNEWNTIGMATWRASGGSPEGFAAFDQWSQKWLQKYDPDETKFRWHHYFRAPPGKIGFGTLVYHARQAQPGWMPPSRSPTHLPEIRLHPGQRERVVDDLEEALIAADCGLYCHGNRLVEIAWQEIAVADGGKDRSPQLVPITELGWSSGWRAPPFSRSTVNLTRSGSPATRQRTSHRPT
jgi:hypothetical protein